MRLGPSESPIARHDLSAQRSGQALDHSNLPCSLITIAPVAKSDRKPEGDGDDLSGTDLNSHFFEFLVKLQDDRQVLVVENTDPPANFQASAQAVEFTKIEGIGRYGFFPVATEIS
jgi:hypothetical protein